MPISLVGIEEIPLSPSGIYKNIAAGRFPKPVQFRNRSWWVKDEVEAWLEPRETVELIFERRDELLEGFTEAELRARRWQGLRDRGYNERALRVLVERGMLRRRKLSTGGRPRVEYQWCLKSGLRFGATPLKRDCEALAVRAFDCCGGAPSRPDLSYLFAPDRPYARRGGGAARDGAEASTNTPESHERPMCPPKLPLARGSLKGSSRPIAAASGIRLSVSIPDQSSHRGGDIPLSSEISSQESDASF